MDKKRKRSITRGFILALLAIAIGYVIFANSTKDTVQVVKIGSTAPDFELMDLNGNKHRLKDYKGQGIVLNFWGTWCGPCEREFPAMENQYAKYKDLGVEIIAINYRESNFEVNEYVKKMGMTFPVAIDKKASVFDAYNIKPFPTTIFIDKNGKIQDISKGEMSEQVIEAKMASIAP